MFSLLYKGVLERRGRWCRAGGPGSLTERSMQVGPKSANSTWIRGSEVGTVPTSPAYSEDTGMQG